jgi:hypothetical protein
MDYLMANLRVPKCVWIETHEDDTEACDVIVEMEDGSYYTALFVTIPYLRRQMDLSYEFSKGIADIPAIRYAALDTPHILVENLDRDSIEDTIDNLLTLETFETLFTLVLEEDEKVDTRVRTAEVAAVVLNEVLMAETVA